jgi:Transglutaminase-like superfamily
MVHCGKAMPAKDACRQQLLDIAAPARTFAAMPKARPVPRDLEQAARKRGLAGLIGDLHKAWARGPRGWADLTRATAELALANLTLRLVSPARLGLLDQADAAPAVDLTAVQEHLVDRVAYGVCAMGTRVPWRSDCLVQALAARRWLARSGIASRIGIGARRDQHDAFMAHAWLTVGERLVTGGDIAPFEEFVRSADV